MTVFERGVGGGLQRLATARWAHADRVRLLAADPNGALHFRPGSVWLGVTPDDAEVAVGSADDRHLVTIAGSRGGKGRTAIIPNLLLYPGSVVCIDPKGENARQTAKVRADPLARGGLGQQVYVLDPFNVTAPKVATALHASFNPLAQLDPAADDIVERAGLVADSLVVQTDAKDAHWDESARSLIEALILHVISSEAYAGRRTLMTVRSLLLSGEPTAAADTLPADARAATSTRRPAVEYPDDAWAPPDNDTTEAAEQPVDGAEPSDREESGLWALLRAMIANAVFPEIVGGQARALFDMSDEERGSVLSTARRNTKFLDGRPIHRVLGDDARPFAFDVLKQAPNGATVYLCLPTRYLSTHARWLRLMVTALMDAMERSPDEPRSRCAVLAICDEFPVLGPLKALETAVGYMAGYHLRLWAILQDLNQLKRDYPNSWETFLGNAGLIQFFANSDVTTLEFLSKRLGETEVVRKLTSSSVTVGHAVQDLSEDDKRRREQDGQAARWVDHRTDTRSHSERKDEATTQAEQPFKTPLMTPDEIALQFRRLKYLQGIISADMRPVCLRRVNYDDEQYSSRWRQWREEANHWRASRPW